MPSVLTKYVGEPVRLEADEEHAYAPPHRVSTEKSASSIQNAKSRLMNSTPTDGVIKGKLMEGIFLGESNGLNSSLTSLQNGRASESTDSKKNALSVNDNDSPMTNGHTEAEEDAGNYAGNNGEIPNGIPKANGVEQVISMQPTCSRSHFPGPIITEHAQHSNSQHTRHGREHSSSAPAVSSEASFGTAAEAAQIMSGPSASPEEVTPPSNKLSTPALANPSQAPAESSTTSLHPAAPRLHHRHTLEVPRVSTSRTSRDFSYPNTVSDGSESGRFSPSTRTPRASNQLIRGPTRSVHSDMYLDEIPQEGDMARWTETVRQKRASRRKRKEEEEDDRVVVGTKVDMNHVNWVTAYNMLTGIRFTVSRTNAKLDRELTDSDFDARHKFSFDM